MYKLSYVIHYNTLWQSRVFHFRFNNGHAVIFQEIQYIDITNSVLLRGNLWDALSMPSFELHHLQNTYKDQY